MSEFYGDTLSHFNPNHDPKNGQFSKGNSSGGKTKIVNKKAVLTGLAAGGLLAAAMAGRYAIAEKNIRKSWNESELDPMPQLLKIRKQNLSTLHRNAVVYTGKRFVLGFLAGYGGYTLTKSGLVEKER